MQFTFSVDTFAIRSSGLIKSASMNRSFFPGSCDTRERLVGQSALHNTKSITCFVFTELEVHHKLMRAWLSLHTASTLSPLILTMFIFA